MNDDLIASIEELGLSQKEARVYLANLMLGPATVQKIADQAGIKRVTTYVILESLNNLGLVSHSTKGKKTFFVAEEPAGLRRLLDKKEQAIVDQKSHFEAVLPELMKLKDIPVESPNVRFYDTAEGIRTVVSSFLSAQKNGPMEVYGVSNLDQIHAFFPEIAKEDVNPDRLRAGFHSKFIYTTKRGPIMKANDKALNRESRFVPADHFPVTGDLSIVGDNIVLMSLAASKPIAVTIHSKELSNSMKALFDLAWESAGQFNK